jgi:hypothetical protein
MEPLWSPVVATGGNPSQMRHRRDPQNQAKTVAVGCDRLLRRAHGKEGVSGSSPEEGSAKAPHGGLFVAVGLRSTQTWKVGFATPAGIQAAGDTHGAANVRGDALLLPDYW